MPHITQKPPFKGTLPIKTPLYDGSARWFIEVAGRIAKAMCKDPINRDLHAVARAFAGLATSARGFIQRGEMEEQVAGLRAQVLEMLKASEHGAGFVGAAAIRAEDANRPGSTQH